MLFMNAFSVKRVTKQTQHQPYFILNSPMALDNQGYNNIVLHKTTVTVNVM